MGSNAVATHTQTRVLLSRFVENDNVTNFSARAAR